jgi:hypothetical protein
VTLQESVIPGVKNDNCAGTTSQKTRICPTLLVLESCWVRTGQFRCVSYVYTEVNVCISVCSRIPVFREAQKSRVKETGNFEKE